MLLRFVPLLAFTAFQTLERSNHQKLLLTAEWTWIMWCNGTVNVNTNYICSRSPSNVRAMDSENWNGNIVISMLQ